MEVLSKMKFKCNLCGEIIDSIDIEFKVENNSFVIRCPNLCIITEIGFDELSDFEEMKEEKSK
jgi:hypothetical protein